VKQISELSRRSTGFHLLLVLGQDHLRYCPTSKEPTHKTGSCPKEENITKGIEKPHDATSRGQKGFV